MIYRLGISSTFNHNSDIVTIYSPFSHSVGDIVDIEISYSGIPPAGGGFNSGTGLFNDVSPSWGTQVTWTLSEPYEAYTWFPCKQDLNDKIDSTELIFTCLDSLKVGSNGLLVEEIPLAGNKVKYVWKSNYPIDYYLISFAVAPYQEYSYKVLPAGASDSMLVQNYIYKDPNYIPYFEDDILETGDMIINFSTLYGLYPFINEKYGHCIAPLGGGMEHQTMTTQGYFSSGLTAHELGHQWWGDNVTCSTWGDIWLNEGFASYTEYIYLQNFQTQADADEDMWYRHQNIMSQPGGSVFVQDISSASNIFDGRLVYDKGAAVVHMMRNYINDDNLFFEALQVYQNTYTGLTASTFDLEYVFFNVAGINLHDFFDAWIYGEGYPTYYGQYNTKDDTIYLAISQNNSMNNSTVFPALLDLQLFFDDGTDMEVKVKNINQTDNYYFPVNKQIDSIKIDKYNWVINKVDSFKYNPEFYFKIFTDINNFENSDLVLVNNPFNNKLQIEFKGKKADNIVVTNSIGKIVYEKNIKKNNFSINTSNWLKGVYFLSIEESGKLYSKKLIKN